MPIIIDSNYLCHQARHSLINLSWEEMETGIIYGFLKQILSLSKIFGTNKFIFTWDSHKSFRKNIFKDYKKKRQDNKTEEEIELNKIMYPQFDIIRDAILPALGFNNNFIQEGFEGDDIIAEVILSDLKSRYIIVSSDHDLYQLLSDKTSMYSSNKKVYNKKNFINEYGINPDWWSMVKAIAGCTTDEVPGVERVGEKTAIKYLLKTINPKTKAYQNIINGNEIIKRNLSLVKLPFKGIQKINLKKDCLNKEAFISVCNDFGFMSFLDENSLKQWDSHIFID